MEIEDNQKPPKTDETGLVLVRLKELMDLNYITDFNEINSPFYISVITEILIHTNHLLQYLKTKYNDRIRFTDDIQISNGIEDITDLITYFRNAACHDISPYRETKEWESKVQSVAFAFIVGTKPFLNYPIKGKYEDDAMILMGTKYLYIKRHLFRVYEQLMEKYLANPDFLLYKAVLKQ